VYDVNRTHQSLGYLAPVEYSEKELAKIRNCYPCGQLAHVIDNIVSQCYSKREANMLMRCKDELWA